QPPLSGDYFGDRPRGLHRGGTELADWRSDQAHRGQRHAGDRLTRSVDVLAALVPAAGTASEEHRNVLDRVDLGVARVAEREDQAVIEQRLFALLDGVEFNKEVPERLHDQAGKFARLLLI